MIPIALVVLAIVDASLAGYRSAAGRNPLVAKRAYYTRAVVRGFSAGIAASALIAAVVGVLLVLSGASLYEELCRAGARMIAVYGVYATGILLAFAVYFVPSLEVRTLASVAIFGPFTMARRWVIVAGALFGALAAPRVETFVACAAAAIAVLAVEPWLARGHARAQARRIWY